MEQSVVIDFLKEIAVGFKSAKSYPPDHPVMDKVVHNTMAELIKIYNEAPTFSVYFLEQTIIFQDLRIDVSKNAAVGSLLEALTKNEINSLTFEPGVSSEDIKILYEIISSPKLKVKQYGDAATMLVTKGTQTIKINAVKFGIQTESSTHATQDVMMPKDPEEIIEELKKLKVLVEKDTLGVRKKEPRGKKIVTSTEEEMRNTGTGGQRVELNEETKSRFNTIITDLGGISKDSWRPYSEAVSRIIENLPAEQRVELFQDVELKPFVLKLFSSLSDDTLAKLILNRVEGNNQQDVKRIITSLSEDKVAKMAPALKEKMPNIYEYLAELGLVLSEISEKVSTSVSKEDLRASLKSYYIMLDSPNEHVREEGLKSLIMLGSRFIEQKNYKLAEEIIIRISTAIMQESVHDVIFAIIDYLKGLYKLCREAEKKRFCSEILEPFSKILGRKDLSQKFKSKIVKFFGSTKDPVVLSTLFSFLWDSGIYPDVRSAIIRFGRDAVSEALLTLKEAEEHSLRTKLIDILKNIGNDSIEILIDNLDTDDRYLKVNIISILGEIGDKGIVDYLNVLAEDKDDRIRLALVKAFANLDYEEGLLKALDDTSVEIKTEALKGLKKRISPKKMKELFPLFKTRGDSIHAELLKILNEKRMPDAAESIVEFLRGLENRDDTPARELKELAIKALVKSNVWNMKTILEEFKRSKDKTVANLAVKVLEKIE